jgi:hypothetical protein
MLTSKGGLRKRNANKRGFQPISDMIQAPGTTFRVLTVESLKGYLIIMNVQMADFEYYTYNDRLTKLDTRVTQYILKFSITDQDAERGLAPFNFEGIDNPKSSDKEIDFFLEAQLQSNLWFDSISSGRLPVCPSVANVSFFRNSAQNLLDVILSKPATPRDRVKIAAIRNYLLRRLSERNNRSIGLITQNLLQYEGTPARQLADVLDDNTVPNDVKRDLIIFAGAQILRLYLNFRLIHCDLHLGNILVAGNECFIIDFGRVHNFLTVDYYPGDNRRYPDGLRSVFMGIQSPNAAAILHAIDPNFDDDRTNVAGARDSTFREIDNIRSDFNRRYNDDAKNNFIRDIFFTKIIPVDTNYLQYFFGQNGYQMEGVMDEIENLNGREAIYLRIFEKYLDLNRSIGTITDRSIRTAESEYFIEKPDYTDYQARNYSNIQFPGPAIPRPVTPLVAPGPVTPLVAPGPVAVAPGAVAPGPVAAAVAPGAIMTLAQHQNGQLTMCNKVIGICFVVVMAGIVALSGKGGKHKRNKKCKTYKNRKTHKRH